MKLNLLMLFLVSANLTFGQINSGFEQWDSVYTNDASLVLANNFGVPNPLGGRLNGWKSLDNGYGSSRTTDSYSGDFSIIVHNWYNYLPGIILYHNSINNSPKYLQGYYKYNTSGPGSNGLSKGKMIVTLTKFNGSSNDTISTGTYMFDTASVYIPFQLNMSETELIADSISIYITNAGTGNNCQGFNNFCNLLYLDNLNLSNTSLSTQNIRSNENIISFYPNPFSIKTTLKSNEKLKNAELTIYNSQGQIVKQLTNISGTTLIFYRDNLPNGLYFIRISEESKVIFNEKLVISE